jgi:hypothetical protein
VWGNSNTGGVNAPAGSGYTKIYSTATVQLVIVPPELLKVMFAMAEPITTIWSAPVVFVRLGAGVVPPTDEEPHARW